MKISTRKIFVSIIVFFIIPGNCISIAQTRTALLYSDYTRAVSEMYARKVDDQITLWEIFLMQNNIPYEVVYDPDLESGLDDDFDVLILPGVSSVSDEEINSLNSFLAAGKSILSVDSDLSLDDKGMFSGVNPIASVIGLNVTEIADGRYGIFQQLISHPVFYDPLSDGILQLSAKKSVSSIIIDENSAAPLGSLNGTEEPGMQTSLAFGKSNQGKFVWAGFGFEDITGGKSDIKEFENLLLNSIKWLDPFPGLFIGEWHNGFNSAAVIFIEFNRNLKTGFIDKLHQENYNPYLVVSPYDEIPDNIKSRFEVDEYLLDLSSFDTGLNESGLSLNGILEDFRLKSGIKAEHILILSEDEINLDSLRNAGIKSVLFYSGSGGRAEIPDNNILCSHYHPDTLSEDGISFLLFKPEIDCEKNPEDDFLLILAESKTSRRWITDLTSLKNWLSVRDKINLSLDISEKGEYFVAITNFNSEQLNDFNIILDLPANVNTDFLSVYSGAESPDYWVDTRTGLLNINICNIKSRETKKILIRSEQ